MHLESRTPAERKRALESAWHHAPRRGASHPAEHRYPRREGTGGGWENLGTFRAGTCRLSPSKRRAVTRSSPYAHVTSDAGNAKCSTLRQAYLRSSWLLR